MHLKSASWKTFITIIVIEPFTTREEALAAEELAIRTEYPKNIVHARCIADAAYAQKYAHLGAKKDQKVNVNLGMFGNWLAPVKEFVEWADVVFLNYSEKPKKPPAKTA